MLYLDVLILNDDVVFLHLAKNMILAVLTFYFLPIWGENKMNRDSKGITSLWQGVQGDGVPLRKETTHDRRMPWRNGRDAAAS